MANNGLKAILFRGGSPTNGTFADRVPGQPLSLKDLHCHCIGPNKDLVLNPVAWTDPPAGQFGTSAVYHNDYRYQRRPQESVSLAREFRIREGEHPLR